MAHGHWTEVEARGVLDAWKKSGLGLGEFARSRGIVPQRLNWWKKKLAPDAGKGMALLPVHIVEPRRGEPVTVLLRSGHMVKVGREFDEVAFARVVAVLEGG
jgi:hypothetical protein